MPHNYPASRKSSVLVHLASKKAILVRLHGPDDPRTLRASAELRFETLKLAIAKALAEAPDMTGAERRELAELLLPDGWTVWPPMPEDVKQFVDRVLG